MYKTALLRTLPLALASALLLACGPSAPPPAEGVVATVNGTAITEADIGYVARRGRGHQQTEAPQDEKQILEDIIDQELIYQRALELGLDADPAYQRRLRSLEAQLNAYKRKWMAEQFHQREIVAQARTSDELARAYFEQHADQIRTEVNVWQILRRDETQIEQVRHELAQGTPFEVVAAEQFPALPPAARKPWDLGYLRWEQLPESWRDVVYDMKPGETSGVVRGLNDRFWIIKLVGERDNPDITYETVKPKLVEMLKQDEIQRLREQTHRALRDKADIVYSRPAKTKD
jgi:peptidyl-prolyl cis-trans isomerase C